MKRIIVFSTVAALILGVLAAGAVYANNNEDAGAKATNEDAGVKCSEATLHGTYLFGHGGVVVKVENPQFPGPRGPYAIAGFDRFDGNGKMESVSSFNFNGNVFHNEHFSGKYTVKADCTGTTTSISGGVPFKYDLFIAPDGSMYTFVQTSPPELVEADFELRGTAKRVGD